jgi:hypothetical protein
MLFLLKRLGEVGYDEMRMLVVRARHPKEAREIANSIHKDEGQIWSDLTMVSCEKLCIFGTSEVICIDTRDG